MPFFRDETVYPLAGRARSYRRASRAQNALPGAENGGKSPLPLRDRPSTWSPATGARLKRRVSPGRAGYTRCRSRAAPPPPPPPLILALNPFPATGELVYL